MAKIKGIYKSFKYISQIFVVTKEREMEIGYPTDVKHVAHIGWDGPSGSAPSWMNEFKTPPDFSTTTLANTRNIHPNVSFSSWSSQAFDQSIGHQPISSSLSTIQPSDFPSIPKKSKRKKRISNSSPTSSSSTSRSSLAMKSRAAYQELEPRPNLQV